MRGPSTVRATSWRRGNAAALALLYVAIGCGSSEQGAPAGGAGVGPEVPSAGAPAAAGSFGTPAGSGGGAQVSFAGAATGGAPPGGTVSSGGAANIACRVKGDGKSTITFVNNCQGTLSFRGTEIEGGDLAQGEHACRDVGSATMSIPAVRYWGFIGTDPGAERHTLAELTLNTTFNDFDFYNISHVDADNLPMRVQPVDMSSCRVLTCASDLLAGCPIEGQFKDASGKVISCVSPDRNDPNSPVAQYFEQGCKDAYSWSGDNDSVAACAGEDYDVVFCP